MTCPRSVWAAARSDFPAVASALARSRSSVIERRHRRRAATATCSALAVFLVFFGWSLLTVPYEMHVEQAEAADAAAQAAAAKTTRLTVELATAHAALDDRAHREIRDTLGRFLAEGTALIPRIRAMGPLQTEVQASVDRVAAYVREALGADYVARLYSPGHGRMFFDDDADAPNGVRQIRMVARKR